MARSVEAVEVNGYEIGPGAYLGRTDFHWLEGTGAKADDGTVWPEGFDPVAAGVIIN